MFAVTRLRLSVDEFWRLTPAQFYKAVELHEMGTKLEDRRFGLLMAVVRRLMGDKRADVWDLFPEHKDSQPRRASKFAEIKAGIEAVKKLKGKQKHGKS